MRWERDVGPWHPISAFFRGCKNSFTASSGVEFIHVADVRRHRHHQGKQAADTKRMEGQGKQEEIRLARYEEEPEQDVWHYLVMKIARKSKAEARTFTSVSAGISTEPVIYELIKNRFSNDYHVIIRVE